MNISKKLISNCLLVALSGPISGVFNRAQAAFPNPGELKKYFSGGIAQYSTTLSQMSRDFDSVNKRERWTLSLGDSLGRMVRGSPTYYHIAMEKNELSLVLSQTIRSQVSVGDLQKQVEKSPFVSKVDMIVDPQDGSLIVRMKLKNQPKNIKVYELAGIANKSHAKIMVDLML